MSSSLLGWGVGTEVVGTLLIIVSVSVLKCFHLGIVYKLALMLVALFVLSVAMVAVHTVGPWKTHDTHFTRSTFDVRELFVDKRRLQVGLFTLGYFLCTYASYSLLPITLAMPLFVTYPVIDILLSPLVNHTTLPNWKQWCGVGLLMGGVAIYLYEGYTHVHTSGMTVGVVLALLGSLSIALRMIYTKDRPTMGAPVRHSAEVQAEHPEWVSPAQRAMDKRRVTAVAAADDDRPRRPSVYHVGIQMLETSTIAMLVFVVLAVGLACVPASCLARLRDHLGVPEAIVSRSLGGSGWGVLLVFGVFVVCTGGGNALLIAADDVLPTNIFASLVYTSVLFSMLSGYFFLGERVAALEVVGMVCIIVGGVLLVALRDKHRGGEDRHRPSSKGIRRMITEETNVAYVGTT